MKYCLIGKSLPHTLSPQIHKEFGFDYEVKELLDETEISLFLQKKEYCGFNVTIPYKEKIMPLLYSCDAQSKSIGAVNTVVKNGENYFGYNTDINGMIYALKQAKIDIVGKNVLILGSGGTSKTADYVCRLLGAKNIKIVSRAGDINYQNCYEHIDTDIIINTTPLGMMPNAYCTPIDIDKFDKLSGVFDAIYNPLETLLVKKAKEKGILSACGLDMLVEQARLAHNIFSKSANMDSFQNEEQTKIVCDELLSNLKNIVIVGMAGVGKSTVGNILSKLLNRVFVDTDKLIEEIEGTSVSEIFENKGEAYFRQLESKIVMQECSKFGRVITTGGGAIMNDKNRFFMISNGVIVHLKRDIDKLAMINRPLSKNIECVKQLWEERKDIYSRISNFEIENCSSPENTAKEICKKL